MSRVNYNTTMFGNAFLECSDIEYEDICKSNGCYEGIPSEALIKLYGDIDYWKYIDDDEQYEPAFTDAFINLAKTTIDYLIDFINPDIIPEYCVCVASSPKFMDGKSNKFKWKISIHIIVTNIITTRENMKHFIVKANQVAKDNKQNNYSDYVMDMNTFFDEGVYNTNQKLRSVYCSKEGENRPLEIVEGDFNSSVISAFIPDDAFTLPLLYQPKPASIETKLSTNTLQQSGKSDDHKFITLALDNGLFIKLAEDYPVWFKFACCVKNALGEDGYEVFNRFSQLSPKYDEHCVKTQWDNIVDGTTDGKKKLTIATIHKWAKDENPTVYKSIVAILRKKTIIVKTQKVNEKPLDYDMAVGFNNFCKEKDILFKCLDIKNNEWCFINPELIWEIDITGKGYNQYNLISTEFYKYRQEFMNQLIEECRTENVSEAYPSNLTPEQKMKLINISKLRNELEYLKTTSTKNSLITELKNICYVPSFLKDMNSKVGDIPLKNRTMLSAKDLILRDRTTSDKFSYCCNAEYIPMSIDDERYKFVDNYFMELFSGDVDTKQMFINVLKTSMAGIRLKSIFFCTGDKGNNGKSTLFAILKSILALSIDTISKKVIIESQHQSTHNTELEKLEKIRIGYVAEVTETDVLNIPIIKQIIGGDPMNLRALHKSDVTIQPSCNLFVLTNENPQFKSDALFVKRITIFPFNNEFAQDALFQSKMIEKSDDILSYILQYGIILDTVELSAEMELAKSDYVSTNMKDYLEEFISESYELGDGKVDTDYFYKKFGCWCKELNYKSGVDTKAKLTKLMKKKGFEC